METTDELNIRVSFSRKSVLLPLILFFICWHPGFIGSETLVLTTYYPAPYGGYVSILTTGQTLLARDTGNVGIRTGNTAPRRPLDVNGEIVTTTRMTLAQDMTNTSLTWHLDNSGGRFRVFQQPNINTAGTERLTILNNNGNVGINTTNPAERLHVANGNLRVEDGNINIVRGNLTLTGNGTTTGFITGICYTRTFGTGTSSCAANYRVMATYGTTSCSTGGLLFLGGDLQNPARWRAYIIEGCAGTMLCCRVRDF
jgi:hypothetical protein